MKLDDPYGYVGGLKVTPDGCHVKPTSAAKIPHHQSRIRFALDDATWQRLRGTCPHLPAATQARRDHPRTHPPPPTCRPLAPVYEPIPCTCTCSCTGLPRRRRTCLKRRRRRCGAHGCRRPSTHSPSAFTRYMHLNPKPSADPNLKTANTAPTKTETQNPQLKPQTSTPTPTRSTAPRSRSTCWAATRAAAMAVWWRLATSLPTRCTISDSRWALKAEPNPHARPPPLPPPRPHPHLHPRSHSHACLVPPPPQRSL
jgi:hypothetical protein